MPQLEVRKEERGKTSHTMSPVAPSYTPTSLDVLTPVQRKALNETEDRYNEALITLSKI